MTRKVEARLGHLDEQRLLHNGLCRWRQEGWISVWVDLWVLALALR